MSDTCPTVRVKSAGPTGWADLDESAFDPARHELWIDPLDHDGDGKKGGAVKSDDAGDIAALRTEYEAALGKRPFMGWDAQTLRAKIAAHTAE